MHKTKILFAQIIEGKISKTPQTMDVCGVGVLKEGCLLKILLLSTLSFLKS